MDTLIIYQGKNTLCVMHPCQKNNPQIEAIAKKHVPTGVKYKFIDITDLPTDRDLRNAWEYDFTGSYDGVGE